MKLHFFQANFAPNNFEINSSHPSADCSHHSNAPSLFAAPTILVTKYKGFLGDSLFALGIELQLRNLEKRKKKNVSSKTIRTLILFILKNSVFRLSNTTYQQIMGTIMGSPMAPNFANLFMSEVETRLINDYEAKSGLRPLIWLRYIDNIFFLWSHDQESLLSALFAAILKAEI